MALLSKMDSHPGPFEPEVKKVKSVSFFRRLHEFEAGSREDRFRGGLVCEEGSMTMIGRVETIDIETGEVIESGPGFQMLPPRPGACQECATDHEADQPHDRDSLYYAMKFQAEHGRAPTWSDAMAALRQDDARLLEGRIAQGDAGPRTGRTGGPSVSPVETCMWCGKTEEEHEPPRYYQTSPSTPQRLCPTAGVSSQFWTPRGEFSRETWAASGDCRCRSAASRCVSCPATRSAGSRRMASTSRRCTMTANG